MARRGWRALTLVIPGIAGMTAAAHAKLPEQPASVIVSTEGGAVQGIAGTTVNQFRAIPYAAPPIGALRWQPPQPPPSWSGTRDATQYGAACAQSLRPGTSEDCLFLNVTVPAAARAGAKLPVMVWIHGGGFITGSSDQYDPTQLAAEGNVVAVTLNYRLGYFGFLAHPALSAASASHTSGNFGLMDQQAALGWVRRNIAAFGGNPGKITIFGESAGGHSVLDLLASQRTGKIAAAIAQSGIYSLNLPSLASGETDGLAVARSFGCTDQTLACLLAIPAKTLSDALNPITSLGSVSVVIDGYVLTQSPANAFASGQFQRVPVINGSNRDEYRLWIGLRSLTGNGAPLTQAAYTASVNTGYPSLARQLLATYTLLPYGNSPWAADYANAALVTDGTFSCNTQMISALLAPYVPVYQYELADPTAPTQSGPEIAGLSYGSAHSADLSYIFPAYYVPFHKAAAQFTRAQAVTAANMRAAWANFARYGRPFARQLGSWPRYGLTTQTLTLVPPAGAARTDFSAAHHCDLWKSTIQSAAGLAPGSPY